MKPSLFSTLLFACLLCGCEKKQSKPESAVTVTSADSRVVELFGGEAGLQPVVDPLKVEAFRIKSRVFQRDEKPQPFHGYPITAGPVKVDAETTKKLARVLTNPATYGWDIAKGCEFEPGVGIRFTAQSSVTEIVFCFTCDELKVIRDGRSVGGEDFDKARATLVTIMGRLFPDDAAIGSLKTREELNRIAQVEARQQAARIRRWTKIVPKALTEILVKNHIETFARELDRAYPNAEDQIRTLMYFEGGSNDSWTSHSGVEIGVDQLLHGYEADQLRGPVREALLGTDRALRRGAARF